MEDDRRLTRSDLKRVIERATQIDADLADLSLAEVRRIAEELDISPPAVNLALEEVGTPSAQSTSSSIRNVLGFAGLGAALGWITSTGFLLSPLTTGWVMTAVLGGALLLRALNPDVPRPQRLYQAASLAAWIGFLTAIALSTPFLPVVGLGELLGSIAVRLAVFGVPSAVIGGIVTAIRTQTGPPSSLLPEPDEPSRLTWREKLRRVWEIVYRRGAPTAQSQAV